MRDTTAVQLRPARGARGAACTRRPERGRLRSLSPTGPFDNRWLYWEGDGPDFWLDRPRADYRPHVFEGNLWLVTQQKPRREWSSPQAISHIGCIDLMDRSATCIPTWLRDDGIEGDDARRSGVLSPTHAAHLHRK